MSGLFTACAASSRPGFAAVLTNAVVPCATDALATLTTPSGCAKPTKPPTGARKTGLVSFCPSRVVEMSILRTSTSTRWRNARLSSACRLRHSDVSESEPPERWSHRSCVRFLRAFATISCSETKPSASRSLIFGYLRGFSFGAGFAAVLTAFFAITFLFSNPICVMGHGLCAHDTYRMTHDASFRLESHFLNQFSAAHELVLHRLAEFRGSSGRGLGALQCKLLPHLRRVDDPVRIHAHLVEDGLRHAARREQAGKRDVLETRDGFCDRRDVGKQRCP